MKQKLLEEEKKPNALAFKVGLIFSFYVLALNIVFKFLKINVNQAETLSLSEKILTTGLIYVPFIVAIMYAQYKHKRDLGGFISYGRAFSTGFRVSVAAGLFVAILMIIYYKVIDQQTITDVINQYIKSAKNNVEQIKNIKNASKYMAVFVSFGTAIIYTMIGLIISIFSALVVKKERPVFIDTVNNVIVEGD